MIVMKFGGTSVADAERIKACGECVRQRLSEGPIVVVSALGGVTDLLVAALELALADDLPGLDPIFADIERRHRWAVAGSIEDAAQRHRLNLELGRRFEELRAQIRSVRVLQELSPRLRDAILASGELWSSQIISTAFCEMGLPAVWVEPQSVLKTDSQHGEAQPDFNQTVVASERELGPRVEKGQVPIIGGFVGSDSDGVTTTLGRGGSDTSAALLAMALNADEIQIWTDVDGMMTADPRRVSSARPLESLSFAEAAEIAFYGARVLHPASVAPAVARDIPVRVLNSHRPDFTGTKIVGKRKGAKDACLASIVTRQSVHLIRMESQLMAPSRGWPSQAIAVLEQWVSHPLLCSASPLSISLVVQDEPPLDELQERLRECGWPCDVSIQPCALICMVGAGLVDGSLRSEILQAVHEFDAGVVQVGSSQSVICATVPRENFETALRSLHRRFFEEGESACAS